MAVGHAHPRLQRVEVAVLGAFLLVGIVIFAMALTAIATADVKRCGTQPLKEPFLYPAILAVVAVGSFGLGRLLGYVRGWIKAEPSPLKGGGVRTHGWLQGLLAVFLLTATLALGYETWAVAHSDVAPPITQYVRCAASNNLPLTAVATGLVCTLLGTWLWYPAR